LLFAGLNQGLLVIFPYQNYIEFQTQAGRGSRTLLSSQIHKLHNDRLTNHFPGSRKKHIVFVYSVLFWVAKGIKFLQNLVYFHVIESCGPSERVINIDRFYPNHRQERSNSRRILFLCNSCCNLVICPFLFKFFPFYRSISFQYFKRFRRRETERRRHFAQIVRNEFLI
jgi:hypothetical protein